jgi:hypothetical protein
MNKCKISGLVIQIGKQWPLYLSRTDNRAVVAEVSLVSTNPEGLTAMLSASISGDVADLRGLGLPTGTKTVEISADHSVELLPGVHVAIRGGSDQRHVTAGSVSLVIDADRHTWLVERAQLVEKRLRAYGRFLKLETRR